MRYWFVLFVLIAIDRCTIEIFLCDAFRYLTISNHYTSIFLYLMIVYHFLLKKIEYSVKREVTFINLKS